jgi:hypothetical protein
VAVGGSRWRWAVVGGGGLAAARNPTPTARTAPRKTYVGLRERRERGGGVAIVHFHAIGAALSDPALLEIHAAG